MDSAFRDSSESPFTACNTRVQCVVWNGAPPSCSVPGTGFVTARNMAAASCFYYQKATFFRADPLQGIRATNSDSTLHFSASGAEPIFRPRLGRLLLSRNISTEV